jgi:hypothetical protein
MVERHAVAKVVNKRCDRASGRANLIAKIAHIECGALFGATHLNRLGRLRCRCGPPETRRLLDSTEGVVRAADVGVINPAAVTALALLGAPL